MKYITFNEYTELGGTVTDEATFNSLQLRIESKINYLTFGRLDAMIEHDESAPDVVKQMEVDIINEYVADNIDSAKTGVQSYSNGIESITYAVSSEDIDKQYSKRLYTKIKEYLWQYPELFYRGNKKIWTQK